jgi:hypothetical protein
MRFLMIFLLALSIPHLTCAQETAAKKQTPKEEKPTFENLVTGLSEPDQLEILHIKDAFSMILTMEMVRKDVENAINACGQHNPHLKQTFDDGYFQWIQSVTPAVADLSTAITFKIDDQRLVDPDRIRDYLAVLQKDGAVYEKKIKKNPIQDEKACLKLYEGLPKTAETLVHNLHKLKP